MIHLLEILISIKLDDLFILSGEKFILLQIKTKSARVDMIVHKDK